MNSRIPPLHVAALVALLVLAAALGGALVLLLARPVLAAPDADGGRRYVAVAAPYLEGTSLLYVLDQETQRLAVYEGKGGARGSHRLMLVAARNISLDTQLDGFNDESEYTYQELLEEFRKLGHEVAAPAPAPEPR